MKRKPLVAPYKEIGTSWIANPTAMDYYAISRADGTGFLLWLVAWPFRAALELTRRHWKSSIKWVLRAPFLSVGVLLIVIVSPILTYQWIEDHWISPVWSWIWSD